MFFVVFLCEPQKYAVVPFRWIYDPNNNIWDRFMNKGLNSSQKYRCYWASEHNSEEFRGSPDNCADPNFAAAPGTQFPCDEGTFICRIIKFACKLNS